MCTHAQAVKRFDELEIRFGRLIRQCYGGDENNDYIKYSA